MQAYTKSFSTFATQLQRPTLDYELCLDSEEAEKSTVALAGDDISTDVNGDWLILNGSVYRISSVAPADGKTKLSLAMPEETFDRPRIYSAPAAGTSIGGFIVSELLAGWRDESDAAYAMPYLQASSQDRTPFVPPEVDDNGMYVMTDYLRTVRSAYHVRAVFEAVGTVLQVTIRNYSPAAYTIIPDDGHSKIKTASVSGSSTAKITTIQPVDTGEVDEQGEKIFRKDYTDWYLARDGSISNTAPLNRAKGLWSILTVSEKADPAERVAAVFAKNSETRKLEFWHDTRLRVHDRLSVLLPSGVYEDTVASVWRKKGEDRWRMQAGQAATTLTEKGRAAGGSSSSGSSSRGKSSSGAGWEIPVGSVFLTVQEGNPADLLGYGAWTLLTNVTLVGAGDKWSAGHIVGSDTHTLTAEELPALELAVKSGQLSVGAQAANISSGSNWGVLRTGVTGASVKIPGEGQAISLVQRSFALYIWLRKE